MINIHCEEIEDVINTSLSLQSLQNVFNQPLGTPITIKECTNSGGQTEEGNERSFVFVH